MTEIYTGHCTGEMQTEVLAEALVGERLRKLPTGLMLEF